MKTKILIGLVIVTLLGITTAAITAGEPENEENSWINIKITNMDTGKDTLSIRVPLSLLELAEALDHDTKVGLSTDCHIDMKKLSDMMKKSKNQFLIKIEDEEERTMIKIWID